MVKGKVSLCSLSLREAAMYKGGLFSFWLMGSFSFTDGVEGRGQENPAWQSKFKL